MTILLEYCLGLRADVSHNVLLWDVRLLEEHGVEHYPFGREGLLNLRCHARVRADEEPVIDASANRVLTLVVRWNGSTKKYRSAIATGSFRFCAAWKRRSFFISAVGTRASALEG